MKNALKGVENKPVANELPKQIIRKLVSRRIVSISADNIWGADHADLHIISKRNKSNKMTRFPWHVF